MEPLKSPNSDQDHDDHDYRSTADSAGAGRTYDCTFCKRGFTNAQALGGHMNIHRKEKGRGAVKAKPRNNRRHRHHQEAAQPSNQSSNGNLMYCYPGILSRTEHLLHQPQQVSVQAFLPLPNPNSQIGNFFGMPVWRAEGGVDANLSLGIGLDGKEKDTAEIDLELRLGLDRR